MFTAFLILLPTAYTLVISSNNLADAILRKQDKCDYIKSGVENIIDEESNTLKQYYKCRENLDTLKLEYMRKFLLDPAFYTEVFPARLSNDTLVMFSVPSKTLSQNIPDVPTQCSSCEGLCMVSEKCLTLLEDVNKNTDPSEISYYKMKYKNCMELLKEQKLKFIRELNLSEDVLLGDGKISVDCKEGKVRITVPESENPLDEGSPSIMKNKNTEIDKPISSISLGKRLESGVHVRNKHSEEVNINSISKNGHAKMSAKTEANGKTNFKDEPVEMNNDNAKETVVLQSNYHKPDENQIYSSNNEVYKENKKLTNDNEYSVRPVTNDETFKKESTEYASKSKFGRPEEVTDNNFNNKIYKNNHREDSPTENLFSNGDEKTTHKASKYDNEVLSPLRKTGTTTDSSPTKEHLGDEIFKRESDCEEILREANDLPDYRTVSSLQYFDKKYAECIKYLNLYKRKYAMRHGMKFNKYESIFPIVLSTGVEKLVTLPEKILDSVQQTENQPSIQSPSNDELSLQPPEGLAERNGDAQYNDAYRNYSDGRNNRFTNLNPELITNERLYESDMDGSISTLVQFTKLIRMYTGQSDRIEC